MRWNPWRDGATAIYSDAPVYEPGGDDLIVVEPTVTAFASARRCACGGALGHRHATSGAVEVYCLACHVVLEHLTLGTEVH
jgi:hypothetical protein